MRGIPRSLAEHKGVQMGSHTATRVAPEQGAASATGVAPANGAASAGTAAAPKPAADSAAANNAAADSDTAGDAPASAPGAARRPARLVIAPESPLGRMARGHIGRTSPLVTRDSDLPTVRWARCNGMTGIHVDYAHCGEVDRCLCGHRERPCEGACGLDDFSWLTHRAEDSA